MKIAWLDEHLLYWTGGVKWILEISRRLKCDMFVTKASDENKMLFNQVHEFSDVSINDRKYWIFYPYFLWVNYWKLRKLLKSYDVIISTSPATSMIASFLGKKSIFVMFEPNVWVYSPDFIKGLHPFLRVVAKTGHFVIKWLDRFAMRKATHLVALDRYRARLGEKAYGRYPDIVPFGVDMELFRNRHNYGLDYAYAKKEVILHVATYLSPVKGTRFIIEALPNIIEYVPNCHLLILNAQEQKKERAELMGLADSLGVGSHVEFLSKIEERYLPYYYSLADVVVQPSFFISHCLPLAEGGACETIGIAFDGINADEVIVDGETGFITPSGNVEKLAQKIVEAIVFPNVMMGRKARKIVGERYSWERSAELMWNMVKND